MLDEHGRSEIPDPRPRFIKAKKRKKSPRELIQEAARGLLSQQADENGFDSWEEANDFDVYDPFDVPIPNTDYIELIPEELRTDQREAPTKHTAGGKPSVKPPRTDQDSSETEHAEPEEDLS